MIANLRGCCASSRAGTRRLAELPDAEYPVLAETARHAERVDPETEFRQGLALILRGLEADA